MASPRSDLRSPAPTASAAGGRAKPASRRLSGAHGWALLALLCSLAAAPAQAQLFKDEELRKAVVDLRARVTQNEEEAKAREQTLAAALAALKDQNAQLTEQIGVLRRSLLDLNNQLESARGELAKLRGTDEQMAREVAELQRRSRDVGATMDDRLRRLEPVKVSIDGREFMVEQEERRAFEEAMGVIRGGDFDRAVAVLGNFQRRYVGSPYMHQARFWLGNALYGKRDYKEAIAAFRSFINAAPDHARAPEALLAVANSQAEMKDVRGARRTIDELIKTYPSSEAAAAGRDRLASLK